MAKTIHARLDKSSEDALSQIVEALNGTESDAVRKAIEFFARSLVKPSKQKIVGLGSFKSGVAVLGSHKKHLLPFGK